MSVAFPVFSICTGMGVIAKKLRSLRWDASYSVNCNVIQEG